MSAQDELGELVERLQAGIPYEYDASENRLVSDISGMDDLMSEAADALTSLIAERDGLREALKPFAEAADVFAREYPAMLEKPGTSCGIRFDALQAARAALSLDTNKGDGKP